MQSMQCSHVSGSVWQLDWLLLGIHMLRLTPDSQLSNICAAQLRPATAELQHAHCSPVLASMAWTHFKAEKWGSALGMAPAKAPGPSQILWQGSPAEQLRQWPAGKHCYEKPAAVDLIAF